MMERTERFFEGNDLNKMSKNLRKVFFDYLRYQKAGLDLEFGEILYDIESLLEFLESISEEIKGQ